MSITFDPLAHQRERTRKAEQRCEGLERHRDQLHRLLVLALDVATRHGKDCDPMALLAVLEQVDRQVFPTVDELAQVLREAA